MTATHIPVGKPANNSESRVFNYLIDKLPDGYTLFTNVSINQGGQDFDFDAIVLGKHAIYIIEIKNFGGIIRGDNFKWQVHGDNGAIFTVPKNPLEQAAMQARVFSGNLKKSNPNFSNIYVQDIVCLAGEKEPQIEIQDAPLRLKKIQWYRGIEKFLIDRSQLSQSPELSRLITDDIFRFHADIHKAIQTGFSVSPQLPASPLPHIIGEFKVEDIAWSSREYKAYLAKREGKDPERVLLKIYKIPSTENPEDAKKYADGLAREFDALKKMSDVGDASGGGRKNVVIGYDAFPLKDKTQRINEYVIVMEWVEGRHLFELVTPRFLSLRQKYQIAAQICRGLMFAHSANVVHRNLNLKNILYEPSGIVKIINFDFAKFLGVSPTGTFSIPEELYKEYADDLMRQRKYVAPEIRTGRGLPNYHDATKETDLYSLGVILLELFSGSLLENKPRPDLNILQSVVNLDSAAVKSVSLLCSEKVEDRKSISLAHITKEFTALAQSEKEIPLPHLPLGYRFGKYEIISHLSTTYMSVVYRAKDVELDQQVAIKFLRASSNDAVNEVRAAYKSWSAIDQRYTAHWLHEGVAFALSGKIKDGSSDDLNAIRVHYIVMEYIDGQNIEQFLDDKGIPTAEKALEIGSKIIQAVSAIHTAQWTHRDIKPANIILGTDDSVRVVDFGLSQRIDEPIGTQGYSPGYTPPEAHQDEPAPWSYAGDVYSTTRVILALLFGEKEAQGPNFDEKKDTENLKQLVGKEIADLLLRDMDQNPKNRHDSAMSMLKDWESITARREDSMTEIDYEKILLKIDAIAKEKNDDSEYTDAAAYRNKSNSLRTWLKNGKQGDCPIDLSEFGVDVSSSPRPEKQILAKKAEEKMPVAKSKDIHTDKDEEEVALSPEERTLQEELKQVREYINARQFREAFARASTVESHVTGNDAKKKASALLDEARQKRDVAVDFALKKADSAFKEGDKELARQQYEVALSLDPDNEHARLAMRKIDSKESGGQLLSEQKITELRGGLRDIKNIKRLGAAVYEAEALYAEGRLTEELLSLLEEAREKFNQIRIAMGDETTMMRFGDLEARKVARDKINDRVSSNELYIFDVTTNVERDAFELLREADTLLERKSEETVQYEIDVIKNLLPAHPVGARTRLENALNKPFHEDHKRKLEMVLENIKVLESIEQEEDKIKAFNMVLNVQDTFNRLKKEGMSFSLPSMESTIDLARMKAISGTVRKMEDAFTQARSMLGTGDSVKARGMVNDGLKLIDAWPLSESSEQLQSLVLEGARLLDFDTQASLIRKEMGDSHKVSNALKKMKEMQQNPQFADLPELRAFILEMNQLELDKQVVLIRKEVEDPHKVAIALQKLEEMRKDSRFADLPELRAFVSEMDQYRDSGDQLREAREARNQGNWKRVYELTTKIKESKKAGSLGAQVDILYADAEQEVHIEDARTLLESLEIRKANSIISRILATEKDESRRAILTKRLASEQHIIDEAIANTGLVKDLYDHAVALRNGREEEHLESLRIFRYLGGITKEKFSADLPDYVLTLRTDDARKAAVDVGNALRVKCLEPLQKAYKSEKRKKMDADDLQHLAGLARILREGKLTHTSEEHSLTRLAEVEWGRHQAKVKETEQDWNSVVAIWAQLKVHYPDMEEVGKELSRANEQQKFVESVFDRVDHALSPRDALLIINDALESPQTKQIKGLKERREQVFLKKQDDLLKTAQESSALGTSNGKLKAFIALVDLRDLEDLMGLPENRRRSAAELKSLNRSDFKGAADGIIQQTTNFSPVQNKLERSVQDSGQLIARLQTFTKIAPLFSGQLSELTERLEKRKNELTLTHQKLKDVQSILEEANKPELWDDAISRGSFDVLKVKRDAMASQNLPDLTSIPDIKEFDQKMSETQEAYKNIKGLITLVKQAFDVSEDFKNVVKLLRLLINPVEWQFVTLDEYKRILDTNPVEWQFVLQDDKRILVTRPVEWKVVSQKEYERILNQMDYHFRVSNIFGGGKTLVGRAEIEAEALRRDEQYNIWRTWEKTCEVKMVEAKQSVQVVNVYELGTKSVPTRQQDVDWKSVLLSAQSLLDLLTHPPHSSRTVKTYNYPGGFPLQGDFDAFVDGNDLSGLQKLIVFAEQIGTSMENEKKLLNEYKLIYQRIVRENILSRKTMEIFDNSKAKIDLAEEWKHSAEQSLRTLDHVLQSQGFPSPEEFNAATTRNDLQALKNLIAQAEQAGALADDEKKRLAAYKNTYQRMIEASQKPKTLWDKFKLR